MRDVVNEMSSDGADVDDGFISDEEDEQLVKMTHATQAKRERRKVVGTI